MSLFYSITLMLNKLSKFVKETQYEDKFQDFKAKKDLFFHST